MAFGKFHNEPNVSLARNVGAYHASEEILVFLDADTRLEDKRALEKICRIFKNKKRIGT